MTSRGFSLQLSATTRRGLTLAWAALFALSMLLTYAATARPVLAADPSPIGDLVAGTTNPDLPADVCEQADFGFVIDRSGSIGDSGSSTTEKTGINSFVTAYEGLGGTGLYAGTRYGDANFDPLSGTDFVNITAGFADPATFTSAVTSMPDPEGYTPTGLGITQAALNIAGDRGSAPNVLFVVTDGSPNLPWNAGDYPSDPDGWLNGANAAITAANAARAAGWFVKAIFVGAPDEGLPFSDNLAWVDAVMDRIGGGSHSTLADFTTLAAELLITTGCKPETGTIIIEKQTNPNGSNEEFEFEASWLDDEEFDGTFFLTDNESESWELPTGSYNVDEVDIPDGWTLTDVSGEGCNEDGKIYISLQAGETVHCTFTNTQRIPPPPPLPPSLTIDKTYTGNTGGVVNGVRVSNSGDVLAFTLAYTIVNPPVTGGIITDVLPAGLDYVAASATGNGVFAFAGYDAGTRTLSWTAPVVVGNGFVTYQVTVTAVGAQSIDNVTLIDSQQTTPDDGKDTVHLQQVLAETGRPVITLPPTDSIQSGDQSSSNPGFGLLLALLAIAGIGLVAGLLVPKPGRLRREEARRR